MTRPSMVKISKMSYRAKEVVLQSPTSTVKTPKEAALPLPSTSPTFVTAGQSRMRYLRCSMWPDSVVLDKVRLDLSNISET